MRTPRGQAVTEVALSLLVLVPILLGAIYLAEASMFRLEATEAATEPLWDATGYANNSYTGGFNRTPGAASAASTNANARMRPRTMLFTQATAPAVRCTAGTGLGLTITPTSSVYTDNGGISCTSQLTVDPRGLTRFFLDRGQGAMFKEPLDNWRRQFSFCQNEDCRPYVMAIGDWGLTNQNGEENECNLTMGGCANAGFFDFARTTYQSHRRGNGTLNRSFVQLVEGVVRETPAELASMTDFQMSFRGEESGFIQGVPVSEGDRNWRTSPSLGAWGASHGMRSEGFLGR